ncbi:MAG TPA: hypothetical protein DEQ02_07995 [Ruminococcaceae bacterium]|nr:hypothetical protein [Oscillospiraceae bacterium]
MKGTVERVRHLSIRKIIITQIMFLLLWTVVTNAWEYSRFLGAESGSWGNHLYNLTSRILWAAPAIMLLQAYKKEIPTPLIRLCTNKPDIKPFIISVIVIIIYNFGGMLIYHRGLWINPEFDVPKLLLMFISVAVVEELVYRGWGLNAFSKLQSVRKANIVSSLFFVLLHLPAYFIKLIFTGTFPLAAVAVQCVMVFILA